MVSMDKPALWTRDFTIITLGTVISLLGHAVSGFALSLLVLDYTGSTLLYSLYLVCYNLPKVAAPMLAGPYLDRVSRKRMIYRLDFLASGLYLALFLVVSRGWFNYGVLLVVVLFIGSVDGVYTVAYDSFYPNLIAPGNFARAYSISSLLQPLATCMLPVASLVYRELGSVAPLFGFNAVAFFVAAAFERTISYQETHMAAAQSKNAGLARWKGDFDEGLDYLKGEKGLVFITAFFFVTMMAWSGVDALILPFFRNHPQLFSHISVDVVTLYSIVTVCGVVGRLAGGLIHYKVKYPPEKKYAIAFFVYCAISFLHASQLYYPVVLMMASFFTVGILSVTSYNIRISATQAYVPDVKRARFNGTFQMITTLGTVLGQLGAGALSGLMAERQIIICFMVVNLLGVFGIVWPGRRFIKQVYNQQV